MEHWYDIPFMANVLDPNRFGLNLHSPLQDMVYIEFSKSYKKPDDVLKSNWRLVPLPLDKVMYAALDCFFAYKLAARLSIPVKILTEVLIL
jgi:ribonuclease D